MTVVQMPDGVNVDFGDLPPDQIRALIAKKFPDAAKPKPADAGVLDATLRGIARGVTGNFIDDAVGKIGGGLNWLGGGSFAEGENRALANARGMDEAADVNHPVLSMAGQVGGGIAQMAVLPEARIAQALGLAGKAGTVGAKVGQAAAGGLTYGAEAGAGAADGGLADRVKGGLEGGLTGLVGGVAGPMVAKGLGAAGGAVANAVARPFRVARGAANPAGEAARRVTGGLAADLGGDPSRAVTAMEAAQRQGAPIIAADMGETTRALGRSAVNTSPEGRAILDQALAGRQAGQIDRVTSVIERAAPGVNAPETRAFLEQAAARANKPAYAKAYLEGEKGVWHEGMQQLTAAPAMQAAIRSATKTGANKAAVEGFRPPQNPFTAAGDGTLVLKPGVRPTLQFWDNVKQNLDSAIGKAQRSGDKPQARDLTRLKQQLVSYLDEAVPSYKQARAGAAQFFGAEDALTAGSNFVTQRADNFREAAAAIGKMNPAERQLFGEGFATSLISRIRETSSRHNVINSIFLSSPAAKERIALALGKGAADRLEATLRIENIMDLTKRALQGNSTTARQLAELGLAGGIGAVSTGGDLTDYSTYLHAAMAYGILHGGKAALTRIDTNVSREVAKLLASDDPKVVKQAIDRIGKSPRLLHALRIGEARFSRALVPLLEPGGGQGALPAAASPEDPRQRQ